MIQKKTCEKTFSTKSMLTSLRLVVSPWVLFERKKEESGELFGSRSPLVAELNAANPLGTRCFAHFPRKRVFMIPLEIFGSRAWNSKRCLSNARKRMIQFNHVGRKNANHPLANLGCDDPDETSRQDLFFFSVHFHR